MKFIHDQRARRQGKAAVALQDASARIAELETERDKWKERSAEYICKNSELLTFCKSIRATNKELLEALEKAEEWLEGWASAEPYLSIIRAAIAKATGERP